MLRKANNEGPNAGAIIGRAELSAAIDSMQSVWMIVDTGPDQYAADTATNCEMIEAARYA